MSSPESEVNGMGISRKDKIFIKKGLHTKNSPVLTLLGMTQDLKSEL